MWLQYWLFTVTFASATVNAACSASLRLVAPSDGQTITISPSQSGTWTQGWALSVVSGDTCTGHRTLHGAIYVNGVTYYLLNGTEVYILSTGQLTEVATFTSIAYSTLTAPQIVTISLWTSTASATSSQTDPSASVLGFVVLAHVASATSSPSASTRSVTSSAPNTQSFSTSTPDTVSLIRTSAYSSTHIIDSHGNSKGKIIGGVLGGILGVFFISFLAILCFIGARSGKLCSGRWAPGEWNRGTEVELSGGPDIDTSPDDRNAVSGRLKEDEPEMASGRLQQE